MKVIVTAAKELLGLFVEDGSLALGILIWLAIAAWGFPLIPISSRWHAPAFFVGLVVLLVENVWRSARKEIRPQKGHQN